jgi:hypothetical protein
MYEAGSVAGVPEKLSKDFKACLGVVRGRVLVAMLVGATPKRAKFLRRPSNSAFSRSM